MLLRSHKGIFSNRSSLVLRAMLKSPEKRWSARDFLKEGVSVGLANQTLCRMEQRGYILRKLCGRNSSSQLVQKIKLITDWVQNYSLDINYWELLHYPGKYFLPLFASFMKEEGIQYALTGFSASRLISPYVLDNRNFVYVNTPFEKFQELLELLQNKLGVLKLAQGGNVWIGIPYYESSVFRDMQILQRYPVASNLQIFLDLMKLPAGTEEVEHLKKFYKRKGELFV